MTKKGICGVFLPVTPDGDHFLRLVKTDNVSDPSASSIVTVFDCASLTGKNNAAFQKLMIRLNLKILVVISKW